MKLLVAMCLLAAGVNAGRFGESGIVYPDGTSVQFTREQADNIVLFSKSGAIMRDGSNLQFNRHGVPPRHRREAYVLLKGPGGVIFKDGQQRQLGPGQGIVHSGPSGTVLTNGHNVQHSHNKRSAWGAVNHGGAIVGESGLITPTGDQVQLPHGVKVIVAGPSAAVLDNGDTIQYKHY